MPTFNRIAVVGAGLIGGSILLAASRRGLAKSYAGWSRSEKARATLKSYQVAEIFDQVIDCVRGADLVIVATPVDCMKESFAAIGPHLSPGALVTDAGSVKASVLQDSSVLPQAVSFVGAHPMAGSEKAGASHADANLFQNRLCFVTPTGQEQAGAVKKVVQFWESLGSTITSLDAAEHDQIVAAISHLPHAAASALMLAVQASPGFQIPAAGQGLRDATRIAAGEEHLWTGILLANAAHVIQGLKAVEQQTVQLRQALEKGNAKEVCEFLAKARRARQSLDRPHEK
jgi:prephenate dehydrogenase